MEAQIEVSVREKSEAAASCHRAETAELRTDSCINGE
jgi:hypothetical protein